MTLKTKNMILNISIAVCSAIFIMHIVLFALFPSVNTTSVIVLFSNSLFILTGSILIHVYYKKSLPTEIILYSVFLISFSIQSLRVIPLVLSFDTYILKIIIGRVSLFFKYIGLLSLLGASLFSFTIKKQKIGTWVLSSILCSFIISSFMHFNTGATNNNLLPSMIFSSEDLVITISLIIAGVITFIKSGFDAKNIDYIYMSGATLALSLGLLLSFFTLNLISGIFMMILFIIGSIFYLRSMHNITLWS